MGVCNLKLFRQLGLWFAAKGIFTPLAAKKSKYKPDERDWSKVYRTPGNPPEQELFIPFFRKPKKPHNPASKGSVL